MKRNYATLQHARVICCGDGRIEQELRDYAERLGVAGVVRFLGYREDVRSIMRASDCLVLPSIASENLSVAVLEGAALGVPAVVTDVGGMAEVVEDGETGRVVPAGSAQALGDAMSAMINTPARIEMGARARSRAQTLFSVEIMKSAYAKYFANVCGRDNVP